MPSERLWVQEVRLQIPGHDRDAALELMGWLHGTCSSMHGSRYLVSAGCSSMPALMTHVRHASRILLPASLSKQDRAFWHGLADKAGLESHSEVYCSCLPQSMLQQLLCSFILSSVHLSQAMSSDIAMSAASGQQWLCRGWALKGT